jgi:hypothetical protein
MRLLLEAHGLTVEHVGTHSKVFTARYYAERLEAFVPPAGRAARAALRAAGKADRPVAPDFRDRMVIVARKP